MILVSLAVLIEMLGSDEIDVRERAGAALADLGLPAIRLAETDPDPEVAARGRDAYRNLCRRLPGETQALDDVDLHALTVCVRRLTGRTILWTDDLGLGRVRAKLVSDLPLADRPELLFAAWQAALEANMLIAAPFGDPSGNAWKIRPCPGGVKGSLPISMPSRVVRVFELPESHRDGLGEALDRLAAFPRGQRWLDRGRILILADFEENLPRVEDAVRAYGAPSRTLVTRPPN